MAYSKNPEKSIIPMGIRHKIITLAPGESFTIVFESPSKALNFYQAIRCFLIGYDKTIPKAEAIAREIKVSRKSEKLIIHKHDTGIQDIK